MTIHEQAKAARALAQDLFDGPCHDVRLGPTEVFNKLPPAPCMSREEARKPFPHHHTRRGFDVFDPQNLCLSCRAYWYAEMAAQTLEREVKLRMLEDAESGRSNKAGRRMGRP
jgi:hypothetical protein